MSPWSGIMIKGFFEVVRQSESGTMFGDGPDKGKRLWLKFMML
jgi:hypothetical protein